MFYCILYPVLDAVGWASKGHLVCKNTTPAVSRDFLGDH